MQATAASFAIPIREAVVTKGHVHDIERITVANTHVRRVPYTAEYSQVEVMSLNPGGEIGSEVQPADPFLRVGAGAGEDVLDGLRTPISAVLAALVPAGAEHNIVVNTSDLGSLKQRALQRWENEGGEI